jgi:hypothetical protein
VSNRRSREARAIQAETGVPYMEALREADRRRAEKPAPGAAPPLPGCQERVQAGRGSATAQPSALPSSPAGSHAAVGEFLHNLLEPVSWPGPPWTHTIVPPEPAGWDKDGNPVYPEPGPAFTVSGSSPYRADIEATPTRCWFFEDETP